MEEWGLSRIQAELEQFNFTDESHFDGTALDTKREPEIDDDRPFPADLPEAAVVAERSKDATSCCQCQNALTETYSECTLTPNCRCHCHCHVTTIALPLTVVTSDREHERSNDSLLTKHQSLLATKFLSAKYDSLGRVAVVKPRLSDQLSLYAVSQPEVKSSEPLYCSPVCTTVTSPIYCKLNTSNSAAEYAEANQPTSLIASNDVSVTSSAAADCSNTTQSTADADVTLTSTRLTEHDFLQVELFYRSHETDVFVARCVADVLWTSNGGQGQGQGQGSFDWNYALTGIPVLVLDSGEGRCRRRRLQVIVAERGTGFTLWRDVINCLTDYKSVSNCLHVLRTSTDHSRLAGLRFADTVTAIEFHQRVQTLTSNPDDSLLNLSTATGRNGNKTARKKSTTRKRFPTKTEISTPCCFSHVTSLDVFDAANVMGTGVISRPVEQPAVTNTSSASDLPRI